MNLSKQQRQGNTQAPTTQANSTLAGKTASRAVTTANTDVAGPPQLTRKSLRDTRRSKRFCDLLDATQGKNSVWSCVVKCTHKNT